MTELNLSFELKETNDGVEYIVTYNGSKLGVIEKKIQHTYFYFTPETAMGPIMLKQDITGSKKKLSSIIKEFIAFTNLIKSNV